MKTYVIGFLIFLIIPFYIMFEYFSVFGNGLCFKEECFSAQSSDWGNFGALLGGTFTLVAAGATISTLLFLIYQHKQMVKSISETTVNQEKVTQLLSSTTASQKEMAASMLMIATNQNESLRLNLEFLSIHKKQQIHKEYMLLREEFDMELNEILSIHEDYSFHKPHELFYKLFGGLSNSISNNELRLNDAYFKNVLHSFRELNVVATQLQSFDTYDNKLAEKCESLLTLSHGLAKKLHLKLNGGLPYSVQVKMETADFKIFKVNEINEYIKLIDQAIYVIQRLIKDTKYISEGNYNDQHLSVVIKGYIEQNETRSLYNIGKHSMDLMFSTKE
ncbi:hypothetical protein WNY51_07040 [Pseudocolwellia sp. AS88]|uniref:hypothetical protein n=1 Tax=Pseudocolwellia sp. AS88 TaxID=3063958 RepID=UPI0026EC394A|nr:hypothetical protein [Pseudocolwellia sp. AS88]MDO7085707.1 hypothetical protein [Pseudocolwellia sp. AS88]